MAGEFRDAQTPDAPFPHKPCSRLQPCIVSARIDLLQYPAYPRTRCMPSLLVVPSWQRVP